MTIKGVTFTEKAAAGEMLLAVCKENTLANPVEIGSYRGFRMEVYYDTLNTHYCLNLCGKAKHKVELGSDALGNLTRIENELAKISVKLEVAKTKRTETIEQLQTAKAEVEREYNEIFVQKFDIVMRKYQAEINRIDAELTQTKQSIDTIKRAKPSYSFMRDMIGEKTIADYDTIERYKPIQVAYWLVNPYYEKIYGQVDDKKDLLELRNEFLSKEFWDYVLQRLNCVISQGYDYLGINMEFLSVVKGLFSCDISAEVKQVLKKVNAALSRIRDMQLQN